MKTTPYPLNPAIECLFQCENENWTKETLAAKEIDRMAVAQYGQVDRDHHLVCEQRSQTMRGFMLAQIGTNMYGFCVRDTMNDGLGNMSGNGSATFALEWAAKWHSEAPDKRAVIIGYLNAADRAKLDEAMHGMAVPA